MKIEANVNPGTEKRHFSKIPFENRGNLQSQIDFYNARYLYLGSSAARRGSTKESPILTGWAKKSQAVWYLSWHGPEVRVRFWQGIFHRCNSASRATEWWYLQNRHGKIHVSGGGKKASRHPIPSWQSGGVVIYIWKWRKHRNQQVGKILMI